MAQTRIIYAPLFLKDVNTDLTVMLKHKIIRFYQTKSLTHLLKPNFVEAKLN
jgi:hypothetical protein